MFISGFKNLVIIISVLRVPNLKKMIFLTDIPVANERLPLQPLQTRAQHTEILSFDYMFSRF